MNTKEAIERIKARFDKWALDNEDTEAIQTLIPELAESEDERIRKALIEVFKKKLEKGFEWVEYGIPNRSVLDWLEKQKEQKSINESNMHEPTLDEARKWNEAYEKGYSLGYKNGRNEQKPAQYDLDVLEKHITKDSISELAHTVMIRNGWDIVEQEQKPEEKPINWTELTWEDINELEDIINKVHYEFRNGIGQESFGKEVLEQFREYKGDEYLDEIEQKPVECIEFDNEFKSQVSHLLASVLNKEWEYNKGFVEYEAQQLLGYAKHEIKPAEWSEDDEYLLDETVQHLEELIRIDEKKHCGVNVQYYQRDIDFLKSLRPSWKPEGQQLDCLRHMINVSTVDKIDKQFVIDLYEQLKKLLAMNKYIDADKLKARIEEWYNIYKIGQHSPFRNGKVETLRETIGLIDSLQQEQPEVDLEKEIDRVFFQQDCGSDRLYYNEIANIARHFAEWGAIHLNARKEK